MKSRGGYAIIDSDIESAAFEQGYDDNFAGVAKKSCPYVVPARSHTVLVTRRRAAWLSGWCMAQDHRRIKYE